jgi:hypothetical protein
MNASDKLLDAMRVRHQAFTDPVLIKCQRWVAAACVLAFAVASIAFGAYYGTTSDTDWAIRASFCFFWMTLGVVVIIGVFAIYAYLARCEEG